MATAIQLVSSHPLLIRAVSGIMSHLKELPVRTLSPAMSEAEAMRQGTSPRLFILDACSLHTDLGPLAGRCRASAPGSEEFLGLLPPGDHGHAEKIRLFSWGIDGFVELHKSWQRRELPQAIRSILKGQLWVPSEVLLAFVKQAKALLDAQLLHGHFLTAREGEILQLLMRRLTNKEISSALGIAERTVKFHVSNILGKLQLADRRGLSLERLTFKQTSSEA